MAVAAPTRTATTAEKRLLRKVASGAVTYGYGSWWGIKGCCTSIVATNCLIADWVELSDEDSYGAQKASLTDAGQAELGEPRDAG